MEEEYAQEEEQLFEQLPETRILDHRHNNTAGGNRVAWLNAERGKMLGPSTFTITIVISIIGQLAMIAMFILNSCRTLTDQVSLVHISTIQKYIGI